MEYYAPFWGKRNADLVFFTSLSIPSLLKGQHMLRHISLVSAIPKVKAVPHNSLLFPLVTPSMTCCNMWMESQRVVQHSGHCETRIGRTSKLNTSAERGGKMRAQLQWAIFKDTDNLEHDHMENAQRLRCCTSRRFSSADPFTMTFRRLVFLMLPRSNWNFSLHDTTWHSLSRNCCFRTDAAWSRFKTLSVSGTSKGHTWCEHQWGGGKQLKVGQHLQHEEGSRGLGKPSARR